MCVPAVSVAPLGFFGAVDVNPDVGPEGFHSSALCVYAWSSGCNYKQA